MSHLPEQLKALAYARKRGTEAPVESIRERVTATFAEIEALVDGVEAAEARVAGRASAWSVQEVVDHLLESDRPGFDQLQKLLRGQSSHEPIAASLQSANPLDLDWDTLRRQFRELHASILGLLATAAGDVSLSATAPVQMVVKCADAGGVLRPVSWVEHFDWKAYAILLHAHNREHLAQIHRILQNPLPETGVRS